MKSKFNEIIEQLRNEASQFNANDVLVNLDKGTVYQFDSQAPSGIVISLSSCKPIIFQAEKVRKEQGLFPLCITEGIIRWEYKKKIIQSPVFIYPCQIKIDKIRNEIQINYFLEEGFVNPFLKNWIKSEFDLELENELNDFEAWKEFLVEKEFGELHTSIYHLGNFHHHRFEILKETEDLLSKEPSETLKQICGDNYVDRSVFSFDSANLYPADNDQLEVFFSLEQTNTVVQGPPGTGKSQVLTNIIGKILQEGLSAVVVSEKRSALDVIQKKLTQSGLGQFTYLSTSETISRDFLKDLKESWLQMESFKPIKSANLGLSKQYRDQLQFLLDKLNQDELIGGLSFYEFEKLLIEVGESDLPFNSDLPDLKEWVKIRKDVSELFELNIEKVLSKVSLTSIRHEGFKQIDLKVRVWKEKLNNLQGFFPLITWNDFYSLLKSSALCQQFETDLFKKHLLILKKDSKEQKKFLSLRKKFIQIETLLVPLEYEKEHWKRLPSLLECEDLLETLNGKGFGSKWRFKNQWQKYSELSPNKAEKALIKWKQVLHLQESLTELRVEFQKIGVDSVAHEMEIIYQQIGHFKDEDYSVWLTIDSKLRKEIGSQSASINQLYSDLKMHFRFDSDSIISEILDQFQNKFEVLLANQERIQGLSESVLRNLPLYRNFKELDAAVLKSNYFKFVSLYPQFAKFKTSDLLSLSETIILEEEKESEIFSKELKNRQYYIFSQYNELLQVPASKLNDAQRDFKLRLKRGKALLVKEFKKSRNLPSIRELFASDARLWISVLKPVWMCNPVQIASTFPLEKELFDVAIFDEASQIPLRNAVGTIYRSKRVLVAGDHQQMGPSDYFKAQSTDVVDLLHQASFYFTPVMLKHHYRSQHPELIRFSNKHFYKDELLAYPTFDQVEKPIEFHYCKTGIYEERINKNEARMVASYLIKQLNSKDHLGIVAFSEVQLDEIYKCLDTKSKSILDERIENDTAFFKALENVQGDECDNLIISFGFAKNEEGEFHMRFGPVNNQNGHKRLNVLFTRARKKIDFFTSVGSEDFKISSNEGVNLLRQYFAQAVSNVEGYEFPLKLKPEIKKNQLNIPFIYNSIQDANELVTFIRVLESRGWKLKF